MKPIHAIYEDRVFKPTEPVDFPERCKVRVEPEIGAGDAGGRAGNQGKIYEILSRRYKTGAPNAAERHNQHQP